MNQAAGDAARLYDLLSSFDSVIVAFSGGVDSSYLAWAATRVLGSRALCVTADSPSYPDGHRQMALAIARQFDLQHEIITTSEIERARSAMLDDSRPRSRARIGADALCEALIGQGVDTTLSQICADALGAKLEHIDIVRGDGSLVAAMTGTTFIADRPPGG